MSPAEWDACVLEATAAVRRQEEELLLYTMWDPEDAELIEILESMCDTQRRGLKLWHEYRALLVAEGGPAWDF